tara:strand:- start:157 stop:315 length:159 start_codon:yes stop_codon:yes gene_type:complete
MITPEMHYLDPGTGSYLIQIIAAAGIAVGIYFRSLKTFLFNLKSKIFNKKNS